MTDIGASTGAARPFFSVVIPLFRGERYLQETLDSLASQDFQDFEVLVVDDGSTDDGVTIARGHAVVRDVISQTNLGVGVARNTGLLHARGRYVAFLDQDDLWLPSRLAALADAFRADTARAAIVTDEVAFAAIADRVTLERRADPRLPWVTHWKGDETVAEFLAGVPATGTLAMTAIGVQDILRHPTSTTTSIVYSRDVAIRAGGFAPHGRSLEDYFLQANVARMTGIWRINHVDVLYRIHPAANSNVESIALPYLTSSLALAYGRGIATERTARWVDGLGSDLAADYLHRLARTQGGGTDALALGWLLYPRDRLRVETDLATAVVRGALSRARHRLLRRSPCDVFAVASQTRPDHEAR